MTSSSSKSPPPPISRRQTAHSVNAPLHPTALLIPVTQTTVHPAQALGIPLRFHVVQNSLQVEGYQIYAVEKWIVERNRAITTLVVYTGDLSHNILVTVLRPSPDLSPSEAQIEWDKALNHLRRDGARPKETPHGVLMATSLAHFRSDYTIVHIPHGDFLAVRERLYTNINLLRMGCSGRSALTLEEPSDTTKDRFISTYHLPESIIPADNASTDHLQLTMLSTKTRPQSHSRSTSVLSFGSPGKRDAAEHTPSSPATAKAKASIAAGLPSLQQVESRTQFTSSMGARSTKDSPAFVATVLELVKLIQAGLFISGMYKVSSETAVLPYLDGLLCDETVEGIKKWIIEVGNPCVGLEPMERIADPSFVAALFTIVLSIRNKLVTLGFSHIVPKDPFLQPQVFSSSLALYITAGTHGHLSSSSPPHRTASLPNPPAPASRSPSMRIIPTSAPQGRTRTGFHFPPHLHTPPAPQITPSSSAGSFSVEASSSTSPWTTFLTRELVEAIGAAYDAKMRPSDGRVRKALREKLKAAADSDGGTGDFERGATSGGEAEAGKADRGGLGVVGGTRDGDREKELLGGVSMVVSSSGGQLLSGIGSLASGLGLGVGDWSGTTPSIGPASIFEGTPDVVWFSRTVSGKDRRGGRRMKGKEKNGDSDVTGVGHAYAYRGKEKDKDVAVGVSLRALWSGGIWTLVKLRELELEKEKSETTLPTDKTVVRDMGKDGPALSDGDVEDVVAPVRSETEEESDNVAGSFGGLWSERMQRKIGSWTGISKRRGQTSLDNSGPPSRASIKDGQGKSLNDLTARSNSKSDIGGPLSMSPTLGPIIFLRPDGDAEDDDLLSSGQVSPIDNLRRAPFHVLQDGRSRESSSLINVSTGEYERKVHEFNQKRPWFRRSYPGRITSWADPVSAVDDFGDNELVARMDEKIRLSLLRAGLSGNGPEEIGDSSELGEWSEREGKFEPSGRRSALASLRRMRSFHDLESLRGMVVLPPQRMRVDVELCGQLLIMHRRERHLQNVVACLHVLTNKLTRTNTLLREDYQSHLPSLSALEDRAQVISGIDTENAKADKISQAAHTLRYETEQFRVPDLWHIATPPRQKVFEVREKVFGTGGRRLAPGVHGAHGRFNRLQWTLDGQERLVDYMGRSESEAEEEEVGAKFMPPREEEDEDEVVRHHAYKPMWLLRFFTSWGAKWGATSTEEQPVHDTNGDSAVRGEAVQSTKEKED